MRLPTESDEPQLPHRPITRTQQGQVQSPTQIVDNGDTTSSSESDDEDVNPTRPLAMSWGDFLSQPEFASIQPTQTQVLDEVPVAPPVGNLAEVDLSLDTVNIPDADPPPILDPEGVRRRSRCN